MLDVSLLSISHWDNARREKFILTFRDFCAYPRYPLVKILFNGGAAISISDLYSISDPDSGEKLLGART